MFKEVCVKYPVLAIIILFLCSSVEANELTSVELKLRYLVFRYYEILEVLPKKCSDGTKKEFISSAERFEKDYAEFNSLIKNSKFRAFAIDSFSISSQIKEESCLYYKTMIDDIYMNTEKEKMSMDKYLLIMRSGG